MFEKVSSNPTLGIDASQHPSASPASQADMGADELMDELFHDLEVDMEGSNLALTRTDNEEVRQALMETGRQSVSRHSSIDYPSDDLLVPYTPLDSTLALREDLEASLSLDLVSSGESENNRLTQKTILMTSACVTLVGISMFWVGRQLRLQHAPVAAAPQSTFAAPQVPSDTVAFADYVSQSLERIHQETKAKKRTTTLARTQPSVVKTLPNAGLPSLPNVSQVGVASPNTVSIPSNAERVYVPVPTPQVQPVASPKPASPPPIIAAAKAAPQPNTPQEDELPVVKPLPLTPPSNGERKFLGGTNLGDQPVFMVSINGSTRHVKLGESIDETGATFVEFDGEQSVLKQGNQLRSVTAGQSF